MVRHTFPQEADTDDAANFGQYDGRTNNTQYVESGMHLDPTWGDPSVTVSPGKAYMMADEQYAPRAEELREHGVNFEVAFDSSVGVSLDSGVNYIWVDAQKDIDDSGRVLTNQDGSRPTEACLLIGECDTNAQTYQELNRAPDGEFESVTTERVLGDLDTGVSFEFESETTLMQVGEDPDTDLDTPYRIEYENRPLEFYSADSDTQAFELHEDGTSTAAHGFEIDGYISWHAGNHGHNSGMNADLVDGYHGEELGALAEDEVVTGHWTFDNISVNDRDVLQEDSFIDADELDGYDARQFIRSDIDDAANGTITFRDGLEIPADERYFRIDENRQYFGDSSSPIEFQMNDLGSNYDAGFVFTYDGDPGKKEILRLQESSNAGKPFAYENNRIWHEGNDGHNSGLAADTIGSYTTDGDRRFKGAGGANVVFTRYNTDEMVLNEGGGYDEVGVESDLDMHDFMLDNVETLSFSNDASQLIEVDSSSGRFHIGDSATSTDLLEYGHNGENRWDADGGRWFFQGGSVYFTQTKGDTNDSYDAVWKNEPSGKDFRIHLKQDPVDLASHRSGHFAQFFASDGGRSFFQVDIDNDTFEAQQITNMKGGGTPLKRGASSQYSDPGDIWYDESQDRFEGMTKSGVVVLG
jgi:hypothetical protein